MRIVDVATSSRAFIAVVKSVWSCAFTELMGHIMPAPFKNDPLHTDVCTMSQMANDAPLLPEPTLADTDVDLPAPPHEGPTSQPMAAPPLSLDGEMPRLGAVGVAASPAAPADDEFAPTMPDDVAGLPTLPEAGAIAPSFAPGQAEPIGPLAPAGLDLPDLPSLPTVAPVLAEPTGLPAPDADHHQRATAPADTADDTLAAPAAPTNGHPMAHLMGTNTPPSEASRKAAEIRAAKKAKARKVKIGVAIGALVVGVAVGPPLFRWLNNAINEAGSTSTEQPAD
jgi:hypothetical protein